MFLKVHKRKQENLPIKLYSSNNLKTLAYIQRGTLLLLLRPLKSTPSSSLEAELNVQPIDKRFARTSFDGKSQNHEEDSKPN